jgi:hypothetical protein
MGLSNDPLREYLKEFFGGVNTIIHRYPLQLIYKNFLLVNQAISEAEKKKELPLVGECRGHYKRSMGLPYKHQILDLLTTKERGKRNFLSPRDFHKHWWIRRGDYSGLDIAPLIREPRIREKSTKKRLQSHRKGAGVNSTQRLPTAVEIIDKNIRTGPQTLHQVLLQST